MKSWMTRTPLATVAVATAILLSGHVLEAQECTNCGTSHGWSNYYAGTNPSAALYPSPRPTPPQVGHTYITYPPFAPHQYLYTHGDRYVRRNPEGGRTTTTVRWGHRWYLPDTRNTMAPFFNLNEALPR